MPDINSVFMKQAILEADKALLNGDWPVGCVIVLDDEIISRGYNRVYSTNNKINHAEIMAIQDAANILSEKGHEARLYVTYEPCPMCLGAILLTHINKVFYGPNLDGSGAMHLREYFSGRFLQDKYKFEAKLGPMVDECKEVFLKGKPVKLQPDSFESEI